MRFARKAGTVARFKGSPGVVSHALLACSLFAGSAEGEVTHTLLPWKAQAGKAFDLMLAGGYACNWAFSHESTQVMTDRIVLAFLATESPNIRCAPMPRPHGPVFKLPALAAGDHPVYSRSLAPCMVPPAACQMHVEPVRVGTLKVTSGPAYDTGWFLHPKRTASGRDVRVSLLNPARGSCENEFGPVRDTLRFQGLELSFHTKYFRRLCETTVRPFGPEFRLGQLAPGSYRVVGYDLPACVFQNPPCVSALPVPPEAVLVDTLVVEGPAALVPVAEPPGRSAPRLIRLGGGLGVVQPQGAGKGLGLQVERIVTPDGRRVPPRSPDPSGR